MIDIQISVYHMIYLTRMIDNTFEILEKLFEIGIFDKQENEGVRLMTQVNVCTQILLHTDSLMDEYNKHFIVKYAGSNVERAKIEQTREVLKPVFKKINQWSEIKEFRNNVLAHNYRSKKYNNKSVFVSRGLSSYNIPQKVNDFAFLIQCIDLIRQVIYQIFEFEYNDIVSKIDALNFSNKMHKKNEVRNYKEEYENIRKEIWAKKEEIEKRFGED